jgi:hypothetical protein
LLHSVRPKVRPPPSLVIVSATYGPLPTPWHHSRIPFKFRTYHRLGFNNRREEIALLIKIVHIKGAAKPMYSFNLISTFTFAGGVWSRWGIKPSNQSQTKSVSLDGELNHQTSTACTYIILIQPINPTCIYEDKYEYVCFYLTNNYSFLVFSTCF